jgi:hypothetical protein
MRPTAYLTRLSWTIGVLAALSSSATADQAAQLADARHPLDKSNVVETPAPVYNAQSENDISNDHFEMRADMFGSAVQDTTAELTDINPGGPMKSATQDSVSSALGALSSILSVLSTASDNPTVTAVTVSTLSSLPLPKPQVPSTALSKQALIKGHGFSLALVHRFYEPDMLIAFYQVLVLQQVQRQRAPPVPLRRRPALAVRGNCSRHSCSGFPQLALQCCRTFCTTGDRFVIDSFSSP